VVAASEQSGFSTTSTPSFSPGNHLPPITITAIRSKFLITYLYHYYRRFPVVEKRWRTSCNDTTDQIFSSLPSDSELADAFLNKRLKEGSARGFGIRKSNSSIGSDSWVDDPITRHIIGLYINKERDYDKNLLWPLILHIKGHYSLLVLPLVEPKHVKAYERLCKTPDCGSSIGLDDSLSSLLLDLPAITGYVKLLYLQMVLTFRNYSFRFIGCH
jgi:hypothetical protein